MENPKGYIIYLKNHEYSVQWANEALASGKALGWNLELYEGVDGTKHSLDDYGLKVYQSSKKCPIKIIELIAGHPDFFHLSADGRLHAQELLGIFCSFTVGGAFGFFRI